MEGVSMILDKVRQKAKSESSEDTDDAVQDLADVVSSIDQRLTSLESDKINPVIKNIINTNETNRTSKEIAMWFYDEKETLTNLDTGNQIVLKGTKIVLKGENFQRELKSFGDENSAHVGFMSLIQQLETKT